MADEVFFSFREMFVWYFLNSHSTGVGDVLRAPYVVGKPLIRCVLPQCAFNYVTVEGIAPVTSN